MVFFGTIGIVPNIVIQIIQYFVRPSSLLGILLLLGNIFYIYWSISAWLGILILLKNPETKIIAAFNEGRRIFWGNLAVGILTAFFVLLWSLLFFVPGLIFMVFYSFAIFAFVYGGYKRSAALKRSKELVTGSWWPVFGRLLIIVATLFIFNTIFGKIFNLFPAETWAFHAKPLIMAGFWSLRAIYFLLNVFVVNLLWTIYLFFVYDDLTTIKPESLLPKEKKDHWLVALSAIALIAALSFLFLILHFLKLSLQPYQKQIYHL